MSLLGGGGLMIDCCVMLLMAERSRGKLMDLTCIARSVFSEAFRLDRANCLDEADRLQVYCWITLHLKFMFEHSYIVCLCEGDR